MSERDEYIPTMAVSNTAPPRICRQCRAQIFGVFYVRGERVLCAKCRP